MKTIEAKANQIAIEMEKIGAAHGLASDPMMVITIISVVVEIIKLYNECKQTPTQAAESMKNSGVLERWYLRKVIRRQINDPEMTNHIGLRMFNSAMKVALTVSEADVQQMYKEVIKEAP